MGHRRGTLRNREFARFRDFSGLCWGKISPTDIDAYFEFANRAFIFIEAKYNGARLPYGQRLALERLVDAVGATKPALLVLAAYDADGDIVLHECLVTEYRTNGVWKIPLRAVTVRELIDRFLLLHI